MDNPKTDTALTDVYSEPITSPEPKTMSMRFQSLDGLRGLVSVYITLFHAFHYSTWNISLAGSTQMPLFFMLSGFVLAITDGKTRYVARYIGNA